MTILETTKLKCDIFHAQGEFFWEAIRYEMDTSLDAIHEAFLQNRYALVRSFRREATHNLAELLERLFYDSQNLTKSWNGKKARVQHLLVTLFEYSMITGL